MKKIGLAGFGVVGKHVYLQILSDFSSQFSVEKVAIKSPEKHSEKEIPFTTNLFDLAYSSDIEIVIEVIGGIQPAFDFIKECLKNKKHVITANKYLIAYHGEVLRKLADENGVQLRYEASVGGAIPILETLNSNLKHHKIEKIQGIINGSTNYVLSQMAEHKEKTIGEILTTARELGFLEADPSFDMEGWDIQQKLSIIIYQAFGLTIEPAQIPCFSLMKVSDEDRLLTRFGKIKYIASVTKTESGVQALVLPELVETSHSFYSVSNENNAVEIETVYSGKHILSGKGAGGNPTASSVIVDLIAIETNKTPTVLPESIYTINHSNELVFGQVYLRLKPELIHSFKKLLSFKSISTKWISDHQVILKNIKVADLIEFKPNVDIFVKIPVNLYISRHSNPVYLLTAAV